MDTGLNCSGNGTVRACRSELFRLFPVASPARSLPMTRPNPRFANNIQHRSQLPLLSVCARKPRELRSSTRLLVFEVNVGVEPLDRREFPTPKLAYFPTKAAHEQLER